MTQSKPKIFFFYLILVLIVFMGCVIPLLVAKKYFFDQRDHQGQKFPDYRKVTRSKFDPSSEGGHLLPNLNMLMQGERRNLGVRIITNSKGFRNDREFDYEVPKGTFRILFLGDSYVDGMRTDQKDTIGYILEEMLNSRVPLNGFKKIEILISGHNNPANAWYYFQEYGCKYNPNLVILGITIGNDIAWHNYKGGFIPVPNDGKTSKLIPSSELLGHDTPRNQDLLLPPDAFSKPNSMEKIYDFELNIREKLAKKFYFCSQMVPPALLPKPGKRRKVYTAGFFLSIGLFYMPILPEFENLYSDFEEVLVGFNNLTKREGCKFLITLFPVRIQVSKKEWNLLVRGYSLSKDKFNLNYPNTRIQNFCRSKDIPCLDLLEDFKKSAKKENKHLYRPRGDMHFNEKGQELSARSLAKFLFETQFMGSQPHP